jgi:predicted N-acetyltransferase YhbS
MIKATLQTPATTNHAADLDDLLWRVLWQPLDLPRDVRHAFSIEGEELELVAKDGGEVVGGLVAVWTSDSEMELRHLAVAPDRQGRGIGRSLVAEFFRIVALREGGRIHTIARSTSAGFFRRLGFRSAQGLAPEHPRFMENGITFELMERAV